ncbi:Uncharacterized protein conserved in bacteria, putative lipoprotein [Pseudomonas aeruginosa]|nr:Uncharacterized protein conserved in bacteria, putative lipoprotein [Pseudomonas aeruginosa]
MKHLLFPALAGILLAPLAHAASFDCEKATRADEKAICANRALNDQDVEMSVKYRFLRGLFAMADVARCRTGSRPGYRSGAAAAATPGACPRLRAAHRRAGQAVRGHRQAALN